MLTLATLDEVLSDAGQAFLAELATTDLGEAHTLRLLEGLRRRCPPEVAGALLSVARLRHKASAKFGDDAARLYFTPDALEQASHPAVRAYRAGVLHELGVTRLLDVCCSIGADSLAAAAAGMATLGLELDPLRVALARLNAAALGLAEQAQFSAHDVTQGLPSGYAALFYDPARRDAQGRRIFRVSDYQPPLHLLLGWDAPLQAAKLAPGVDKDELRPYAGQLEFISVDGDLKEALLWRGADPRPQATLIAQGQRWHYRRVGDEPQLPIVPPQAYLIDPDPALIRAGLVQDVAAQDAGAALLDPHIAYYTTPQPPSSYRGTVWQVWAWLPFQLKHLRAALRARDVGTVTVLKRGSPITPEQLTAQLKLKGSQSAAVILTRWQEKPIAILAAPQPIA